MAKRNPSCNCSCHTFSDSLFNQVEQAPPIEVFELTRVFQNDEFEDKVNLGVGAYRTNAGVPWVLPVVRRTEITVASDVKLNHEYLPVLGSEEFTNAAIKLLLGEKSIAIEEKRAFGIQSLSGTGAITLGAIFCRRNLGRKVFYYSNPTWENHHKIFMDAGFEKPRTYRYWDSETRGIDMDGLLYDLRIAPAGAVIILHACAHNPTGNDPTEEQWKKIADVMESENLIPFFDSAYQGFASGDPDRDAWAVRYFVERGFELFCAQSFAKNIGLYSERIGNLCVVQRNSKTTEAALSQFTLIVRGIYSNPPAFGARIVTRILTQPDLFKEWLECIKIMSTRLKLMREALRKHLVALSTPGAWDHITNQIGLFSYTGLTEEQVQILVDEYHVYLLKSGRINVCGLNERNVEYVANAMHDAILRTLKM